MNQLSPNNPNKWTPLTGMPEGAGEGGSEEYAMYEKRWESAKRKLTEKGTDRSSLNRLLVEQNRAFAIETGQIEGLYTFKQGFTEQMIVHGFKGVKIQHTDEDEEMTEREVKGLLEDQKAAIEMSFGMIKNETPLSHTVICEWHALLTRHQETVTVRTRDGSFIKQEFPQSEKGAYKTRPNNPRQENGEIYEYCPPSQCRPELDRMLDLYRDIHQRKYPVAVEAAWLHHRFVRTHPFRDGNGRLSRLLMAYVYMRRGLPPPLIKAKERRNYIEALREVDHGDLRPFADFIQSCATEVLKKSVERAENILKGDPSPQENSPAP